MMFKVAWLVEGGRSKLRGYGFPLYLLLIPVAEAGISTPELNLAS